MAKLVEGGAKITFCKFHGTVTVKTFFSFSRSIFLVVYQEICFLLLQA